MACPCMNLHVRPLVAAIHDATCLTVRIDRSACTCWLQALQDSRNFAELPQPQELQQLVLAKQLRSLENVFERLQEAL